MIVRLLIALTVLLGSAPVVVSAPPRASQAQLEERADVIATGAVRRIYASREGSRTEFIAEVTLESCAKGDLDVGDVLRVAYHDIAPPPMSVGSSGHTFQPRVGQRIDVYARATDDGHEALFPNGIHEAEALVFLQVHDAEAYDALIDECERMDRYLLGLEFASKRLGIEWSRDAARSMLGFARQTGEHTLAMKAFTDRLRTDPDDPEALSLVGALAWELREDRAVFDGALAFAREQEHAALLAALALQADWEGSADAFALFDEAIEMEPELGGARFARWMYVWAIDAAYDAEQDRAAAEWLAYARERWPEDEMNWRFRER